MPTLKGKAGKDGTTLYEQQRRRTAALAQREELRNAQTEKRLVSREAVERAWFTQGRQVRDALENIPARLAGLLAAEKNQDKCFALLQKEIRQALEGLTI
jgi:phage terminase Nu1 subunit (DNA packaging protein)